MMFNREALARALVVALIGAPVARATSSARWMSDLDFMKGSWVQDEADSSTLIVASQAHPASLTIRHRVAKSGAIGGQLFDSLTEQHIYERAGKLEADDWTDDNPHPPIHTNFTSVSIIPGKSVILATTVKETGATVEISYWVCEWNAIKLCLSYRIIGADLRSFTLATAVLTRY